jgi:uncharacterized membrane protein
MAIFSSPMWQGCFIAAIAAMFCLSVLDRHLSDADGATERLKSRVHAFVAPHAWTALRIGCSIYFLLAAWGLGKPVYLTPELGAPSFVPWIQTACAVLVLFPGSAWIAGLALMGLYLGAICDYGWFHLLDYPLFLFIGATLFTLSTNRGLAIERAFVLLRWGVALTLLWGGIEKFAYPDWSFPMLIHDPRLSFGLAPATAMIIYGFGEIAMSYGLLFFRTGSQVASAMLLSVFVAAIPMFGWIDLVGHSGVIVVLALLTVTRTAPPVSIASRSLDIGSYSAMFPALTLALSAAYFGLHAVWLPTPAGSNQISFIPSALGSPA